jgi:hypothetical protein
MVKYGLVFCLAKHNLNYWVDCTNSVFFKGKKKKQITMLQRTWQNVIVLDCVEKINKKKRIMKKQLKKYQQEFHFKWG